jgi:hypothetical protein
MLRIHAAVLLLVACAAASDQSAPRTARWAEGSANCTLRASDDGHTYYGFSSGDFEITLGVDRQELEKVPHRALPMLGVFLSFSYKGSGQLEVGQNKFALEFLKHRRVVQSSLDPEEMIATLQDAIDEVTHQVEKHQRKHPEQKEKEETELQARIKDYTEMMEFINARALHPTSLDGANRSASGWVFFSTENRWIGAWRRPEQFVLRVPVENLMVEFPFQLPPKAGKVELRRRSEQ